ncbi:MAG: large conductance mechanosensitive channel protein MscL [Enterococcus sp.]
MLKEFKEFIMKGDVLDLAVGVVIGSAFTAIVNGFVEGLITPLIALVVSSLTGTTSLEGALSVLDWKVRDGVVFAFGDVITAVITFLITGLVLFIIVKAVNKMRSKEDDVEEVVAPTTDDYLAEIRDLLKAQAEQETLRNKKD